MQERAMVNSNRVFNIIKFIGAVVIFYLGIKLFVGNIGENVNFLTGKYYDDVAPVEYEYNEDWANEIGMHNISEVEQNEKLEIIGGKSEEEEFELKYQTLCSSNFNLCVKVDFLGNISSKDKFMYYVSTVYVLNMISKNIQIGGNLMNKLKTITIDSAYGATRGSADWDSVSIKLGAVRSYVEYIGLISHELGHVVDLGVIQGYSSEKDSNYTEFGSKVFSVDDPSIKYYSLCRDSETVRKSTVTKEDFCSGYGMTDPFEDFAECHNMYLNHNDIFKSRARVNEIMKQKYNFFANLYGGKFMFSSASDLSKFNADNSWRPWDTTKM